MTDTRNYVVSVQKNQEEKVLLTFRFILFYPRKDKPFYGTGCYMDVTSPSGFEEYVDVRYTGKHYLPDLVELWLKDKYGDRLINWREI